MSTIVLVDKTGQISQQAKITLDTIGLKAAITSLFKEGDELSLIVRITSYETENTTDAFIKSITLGLDDGTGTPAYMKRYVALMTQTADNDPVATELENDLGTITWSRISAGVYDGVLSGGNLFVEDKTFVTRVIESSATEQIEVVCERVNTTTIRITGMQSQEVRDQLITDVPIEIRVYN